MKKYQYILLDWDGNLAKTLDVWLIVTRLILEKYGHVLADKEIASYFGAFTEHLNSLGITDTDQALNELIQTAKQRLPDAELYPDALEVLEYLHDSGKDLALITTSVREHIDYPLSKYKLHHLFKAVVCGDEVKHHKPHPEPLEKALKGLHGNKDQAVMIGDSDKDLGAAANAGIDSILFFPPEHQKFYDLESLKKLNPTYTVKDFREIKNIIK